MEAPRSLDNKVTAVSIRDAVPSDAAALVAILNPIIEARVFEARRKGYEKIFTFVRADNPAALQTHLAHGFAVIGTARKQPRSTGGTWTRF